MTCSGLHCAGCAGGAAVPVVPLIELYSLAWVAEHLLEVATVSAACAALSVLAVVWLTRRGDRRDARQADGRPLLIERDVPAAITPLPRRAVGAAVVNLNFYDVPASERAAIIRQAIPGQTWDAITERPPS